PLPGRNLAPVPVAPRRGPLPRSLGRRPRLRGDGDDCPAADRSPVRRPVRVRSPGRARAAGGAGGLRPRTRLLAPSLGDPGPQGRFRGILADGRHGGPHGEVAVDVIELRYRDRTLRAPAWIMPGHPDRSATVYLGYGRTFAGKVGSGAGFNAYALRTSDAPWFDQGLSIRRT